MKQAHEDYVKENKRPGILTLDTVITFIAHHRGVDEALIKSTVKERTVSQARAITAHIAIDRLRITGAEIASNTESDAIGGIANWQARGRNDPLSAVIETQPLCW